MSSFTLLNLASREKNPNYHDKTRDMETALAWNAIQKPSSIWIGEIFQNI